MLFIRSPPYTTRNSGHCLFCSLYILCKRQRRNSTIDMSSFYYFVFQDKSKANIGWNGIFLCKHILIAWIYYYTVCCVIQFFRFEWIAERYCRIIFYDVSTCRATWSYGCSSKVPSIYYLLIWGDFYLLNDTIGLIRKVQKARAGDKKKAHWTRSLYVDERIASFPFTWSLKSDFIKAP